MTVSERIKTLLERFTRLKADKIEDTDTFDNLGLDSLDRVELVMELEKQCGVTISDCDVYKDETVEQMAVRFTNLLQAKTIQ